MKNTIRIALAGLVIAPLLSGCMFCLRCFHFPETEVQGLIVDSRGAPLSDARVKLVLARGRGYALARHDAVTGKQQQTDFYGYMIAETLTGSDGVFRQVFPPLDYKSCDRRLMPFGITYKSAGDNEILLLVGIPVDKPEWFVLSTRHDKPRLFKLDAKGKQVQLKSTPAQRSGTVSREKERDKIELRFQEDASRRFTYGP